MTKKSVAGVVSGIVLGSALVLSGCAGGTSAPGADNELTLAFSADPVSLDPSGSANGNASQWYVQLAYQSLLSIDEDGQIAPGLAESWEYLDDEYKQFKITLREDARFADGTPVTAEDVVASLGHFKEGTGPAVANFRDIEAEAVSDREVVYTSSKTDPLIATLLTPKYMGGAVISPAGLENPDALLSQTFGAGPYVLDSANTVEGDHYTYVPNEHYYDQSQVKWDEVTIRVIPNSNSQAQALKTGQVDVMLGDKSILPDLEGAAGIGQVSGAVFWNGIHFLDRDGTLHPALADVRVRQALNYAIDREAIAQAAYGEFATAESQPATPGDPSFGYDEALTDHYPYDPDRARQLLEEAGFPDGLDLSIAYKGHQPASKIMVEAMAAQFEEIGVNVTLVPTTDTGDWVTQINTKKYGAAQHDDSGKPVLMRVPGYIIEGGVLNQFGVEDPVLVEAYEDLVAAGLDEDGAAARNMIRVMTEQAITVPVAQVSEVYFYNETVLEAPEFLGGTPLLSYIYDWEPSSGD